MYKKGFIYKITSPSGKVYIGQTISKIKRYNKYKNNGCKQQPKLYNSLKKYGFNNHLFEVIEECDIENLNERERYWQDFYDATGKGGLNCRLTNTSDKSGYMSIESRLKMSESQKLVKHTYESRKKISEYNKGRKMSAESIAKAVDSRRGFKHSQETKDKLSKHFKGLFKGEKNPFYGKKHSQEIRDKISLKVRAYNLKMGRIAPPPKNKRIKKTNIDIKDKNKFYYLDQTTGVFFDTCKDASFSYNIKRSTLEAMTRGQNPNKTNIVKV